MNLIIEVFGLSVSAWAIYFYLRRQPALDEIAVRVRWYVMALSAALYFGVFLVFRSLPRPWVHQNTPVPAIFCGIRSFSFFCFLLLPGFSGRIARRWLS